MGQVVPLEKILMGSELARDPIQFTNIYVDSNRQIESERTLTSGVFRWGQMGQVVPLEKILMGPEHARDPIQFTNIFVDSNGSLARDPIQFFKYICIDSNDSNGPRACEGPYIVHEYICSLMGPELARDPIQLTNIFVDSNGSQACKGPKDYPGNAGYLSQYTI